MELHTSVFLIQVQVLVNMIMVRKRLCIDHNSSVNNNNYDIMTDIISADNILPMDYKMVFITYEGQIIMTIFLYPDEIVVYAKWEEITPESV